MRLLGKKREYVVVSVGGSLIVPDQIDTAFLQSFRELLLKKVGEGFSFMIIAGGGKTCRRYQEAARLVRGNDTLPDDEADWIGVHSTRLNAQLVKSLFYEHAQTRIVKNYHHRISPRAEIIVGAGWKPGWSTDYDAVLAAKHLGAKKLVNLSNIDYVYTADPRKDLHAEKIEKIGWTDFRKLLPEKWDPGLSSPFDPVAAKEAQSLGLEVVVMNGDKIGEFENYLDGKPFTGTVIS